MLKIFEKDHLRYQAFVFQFAVAALAKGKPTMTKIVWVIGGVGGGGGNYLEKINLSFTIIFSSEILITDMKFYFYIHFLPYMSYIE